MSELLQQLTRNCFSDRDATAVAQEQAALAAAGDGGFAGG